MKKNISETNRKSLSNIFPIWFSFLFIYLKQKKEKIRKIKTEKIKKKRFLRTNTNAIEENPVIYTHCSSKTNMGKALHFFSIGTKIEQIMWILFFAQCFDFGFSLCPLERVCIHFWWDFWFLLPYLGAFVENFWIFSVFIEFRVEIWIQNHCLRHGGPQMVLLKAYSTEKINFLDFKASKTPHTQILRICPIVPLKTPLNRLDFS